MATTLSLDADLMRRLRDKWEAEADDPARPPDLSLEQWLMGAIPGVSPINDHQMRDLREAIQKRTPSTGPRTLVVIPPFELRDHLANLMAMNGPFFTIEKIADELLPARRRPGRAALERHPGGALPRARHQVTLFVQIHPGPDPVPQPLRQSAHQRTTWGWTLYADSNLRIAVTNVWYDSKQHATDVARAIFGDRWPIKTGKLEPPPTALADHPEK